MENQTQLERYKKLIDFVENRFKEEISIKDIEDVSFYSYRNINRIFLALQHETIGQYVKRMKLEKAAEYLKFSEGKVSDIAFEVGYSDIAAFSKAFKKQFGCSPSTFRNSQELKQYITQKTVFSYETPNKQIPKFEIEEVPGFDILSFDFIKVLMKI